MNIPIVKKLLASIKSAEILLSICLIVTGSIGLVLFVLEYQNYSSRAGISEVSEEEVFAQNTEAEAQYAYIEGEIEFPGVYEIFRGDTMINIIERSGGYTENTDLVYVKMCLNLAEKLQDQQKIYLPAKIEELSCNSSTSGAIGQQGGSSVISINASSKSELETLPGIGPSFAQRIIEGRPYESIEDLMNVKGIGDATFSKIQALISL